MRLSIKRMSLKQLQMLIEEKGPQVFSEVIDALKTDPRNGAQRLVRLCRSRMDAWNQEQQRLHRMLQFEEQLWAMGYRTIAGLDAVGRGPLAGPVVAAAVVLPRDLCLNGLDDCKRLSPPRRRELAERIRDAARDIGIGMVDPEGVDESSVLQAIYTAMSRAVQALPEPPDYLLVNSLIVPGVAQPQHFLPNGESISCTVAAASVLAKVSRDDYMVELDRLYPQYGFARHKGYGTAEHRQALRLFGPCPAHRRLRSVGEIPGVGDVL